MSIKRRRKNNKGLHCGICHTELNQDTVIFIGRHEVCAECFTKCYLKKKEVSIC
jgi:hypothetical protein